MEQVEIPAKLYYWIGASVVSSFGCICALIWLGLTMSWKLSERFTKIEVNHEKDFEALDTKAELAHGRIDKLENKVWK